MARRLIAGNWKMNGTTASIAEIDAIVSRLNDFSDLADCLICPPATLISAFSQRSGSRLKLGGQSCHSEMAGAFTGDVSAAMLKDAGASYVIVGHSERREFHNETDATVAAQAAAALSAGLTPIICVGESLPQRKAGDALVVVEKQLNGSIPDCQSADHGFVVAYEPIWAIGTGEVATPPQIAEIHGHMRSLLRARFGEHGASVPLLYGGSMKPGNAADILNIPNVDGGLIGGASLKADDFMAIYAVAVGED